MADEVFVGQDAGEVRMAGKDDPVQIEGFALEPVGALVDVGEGVANRILFRQRRLQPDVVLVGDRIEMKRHFEPKRPGLVVQVVDAAQVEEELVVEVSVVAQRPSRFLPGRPIDGDGEIAAVVGDSQDLLAELLGKDPIRRFGERPIALKRQHTRHGANRDLARHALRSA